MAILAITGSDSAPVKANEAKQKNDIGAAKDQVNLFVENARTEAYEEYYVKDAQTTAEQAPTNVSNYVKNKVKEEYLIQKDVGLATIVASADGGTITVSTTDFSETGYISETGGLLTWGYSIDSGLSEDERRLLATNNMAELTSAQIDADTSLTPEQKTALKDGSKIKAVLSGNVPVPVGYNYMEGTSTAQDSAGENGWGVVVTDGSNNEWVWVPCNANESVAPSDMFETITTNNRLGSNNNNSDVVEGTKLADVSEDREDLKVSSRNNSDTRLLVADNSSSSSSSDSNGPMSYEIDYYKDDKYYESDYGTLYYDSEYGGYYLDEEDIDTSRYLGYRYVSSEPSLSTYISSGTTIHVYYELDTTTDEGQAIATTVEAKSKGGILSGFSRGNPTQTGFYREPSLVTDYDLQEQYYTQAGFTSSTQMAETFKTDFENMAESIAKYGGFYVGRYELSGTRNGSSGEITNPKVQAGQAPMDNVNWYRLYQACRTFGDETVQSTMIWGTQWDAVCRWTNDSGDEVSYSQYKLNRHSRNYNAKTGSNENDKRNNVCDLDGSRYEWTQEAYDSDGRAWRGGYCFGYDSAGLRSYTYPYYYNNNLRFTRHTLHKVGLDARMRYTGSG